MRVTSTSTYRNFTNSVNDVHGKLNKSMNKVSSGKAYESASENPLAYYEGKKIDNQYQDTLSKLSLVTNVKNRIYQQELGARSIQESLSGAKTKLEYIRSDSNNGEMKTVETVRDDLLQKAQSMVNELNGQYQNYYIYGGGDTTTAPFKLSEDGQELTFNHTFPGDSKATEIKIKLDKDTASGDYKLDFSMTKPDGSTVNNKDDVLDTIAKAMKEQGRVDIGYGTITNKDTLLDTFTGGLNVLTGLSSDAAKAFGNNTAALNAEIEDRLLNSSLFLTAQGVATTDAYANGSISKETFSSEVGEIIDKMTDTEHTVSTVYSDLGNKYSLLEKTEDKLKLNKDNLTEQFTDILGADPYESVMEMYSYQYSYNAALKVGTNLMQSSLFDFMR